MSQIVSKKRAKMANFLAVLLLLFCSFSCSKRPEEISGDVIIASGSAKLVYYPMAVGAGRILSNHLPGVNFQAKKTSGSIENARLLREKKVDLALMQGDMAYDLYKGKGPFEGRPLKSLRLLLPLHREYVHIIVSSKSKFKRVSDLVNAKISVGKKGSASLWNAQDILRGAGIPLKNVTFINLTLDKALEKLVQGEGVDAIFLTAGTGVAKIDTLGQKAPGQKEGKIRLLSLKGVALAQPYYLPQTLTKKNYSWIKKPLSTVAITSVLVCRKDLDKFLGREIVAGLLQNWTFLTYVHPAAQNMALPTKVEKFHIPLHKGVKIYFRDTTWYLYYLAIGLVIALLLLWGFKKFVGTTKVGKKFYFRFKRVLLEQGFWYTFNWFVFWLVLTWIVGCLGIYFAERDISPEQYGSFWRTLHTFVLFLTSGLGGGYLPKTEVGWIFGVFTILCWAMVGLFYGGIINAIFVKNRMDLSRRKFDSIEVEGHVVVMGWNENIPDVIAQIQSSKAYKKPVIIATKMLTQIPDRLLKFKDVYLLYGDPYSYPFDEGDILERANIEEAVCVLVVPEENEIPFSPDYDHREVDEVLDSEFEKKIDKNIEPLKEVKLFLRTLAVQKYLEAKKASHVHVVTQCHLHETIPYLAELNVDEVVHVPILSRRLLSQIAITHFGSRVYRQLLSLGHASDIHRVEIPKNFHGRTFGEAYDRLFWKNLVLIGVIRKNPTETHFPYEKLYEAFSEDGRREFTGKKLVEKNSPYRGEEVDLLPLSGPLGTDKSSVLMGNYKFTTRSKDPEQTLDVALVVVATARPSRSKIRVF